MTTRMMFDFLKEDCPLFSRALNAPWRLCFLAVGVALLAVAFLLMWVSIDGVYSLFWWCRGFDALQIFRGANAIYSLPLYFAVGFAMNVEVRCGEKA